MALNMTSPNVLSKQVPIMKYSSVNQIPKHGTKIQPLLKQPKEQCPEVPMCIRYLLLIDEELPGYKSKK